MQEYLFFAPLRLGARVIAFPCSGMVGLGFEISEEPGLARPGDIGFLSCISKPNILTFLLTKSFIQCSILLSKRADALALALSG